MPEGAKYCPGCGEPATSRRPEGYAAGTGLDRIGSDRALREHWIHRLIALVVDGIIVSISIGLLLALYRVFSFPLTFSLFIPFNWFASLFSFPLIAGLVFILYFSLAEATYGQTLGKRVTGLRVVTAAGARLTLEKAFIRNLSKIHWVLLLLDVVAGLCTRGDPRQKFSDRFAGTTVVGASR